MALFKILSNFPNSPDSSAGITTTEQSNITTSLPAKANQGYCYFDVKTGKWWVDIAGDGDTNAVSITDVTSTATVFNRMPLNAYKADIATLAKAAVYSISSGKDPINNSNDLIEINKNFGAGIGLEGNTIKLKNAEGNWIDGSNKTLSLTELYWANQQLSSASSLVTNPTFKTMTLVENNSTAATKNISLQYNATTETLNFVFT